MASHSSPSSTTRSKRIYGPAAPKEAYPKTTLHTDDDESSSNELDSDNLNSTDDECGADLITYNPAINLYNEAIRQLYSPTDEKEEDDEIENTQEYYVPLGATPALDFSELKECYYCLEFPCTCAKDYFTCEGCLDNNCPCQTKIPRQMRGNRCFKCLELVCACKYEQLTMEKRWDTTFHPRFHSNEAHRFSKKEVDNLEDGYDVDDEEEEKKDQTVFLKKREKELDEEDDLFITPLTKRTKRFLNAKK